MKNTDHQRKWLLLIHQLPAKPSNLRVRVWRKLQILGAISIKNSVYVLPFNEKTNEDFQWLKQEIETAGGEAAIFRADSVEGATDQEIITLFCRQRGEEYEKLISELIGLSGAVHELEKNSSLSVNKISQYESEFSRLGQEMERVIANDFFQAANGKKARSVFEKCRLALQSAKGVGKETDGHQNHSAKLKLTDYQSKRWITRKNPHIDRLASGWLIKRFIDNRPRFSFVEEGESIETGVSFDMVGANFTHQGEDCTFETLIKSFGLDADFALRQIAEIVHDIDLKDNKFNRSEAAGLNAVVRGLAEVYANDNERLKQSLPIFDGLYELFRDDDRGRVKETAKAAKKREKK